MKLYDTSFFCHKGRYPRAHLAFSVDNSPWPVSFALKSSEPTDGTVTFYLKDESDFIAFKNSVIECYDSYRRLMKYDK